MVIRCTFKSLSAIPCHCSIATCMLAATDIPQVLRLLLSAVLGCLKEVRALFE